MRSCNRKNAGRSPAFGLVSLDPPCLAGRGRWTVCWPRPIPAGVLGCDVHHVAWCHVRGASRGAWPVRRRPSACQRKSRRQRNELDDPGGSGQDEGRVGRRPAEAEVEPKPHGSVRARHYVRPAPHDAAGPGTRPVTCVQCVHAALSTCEGGAVLQIKNYRKVNHPRTFGDLNGEV